MVVVPAGRSRTYRAAVLGALLAVSVVGGSLSGTLARPDAWFLALEKPSLMPPLRLFPPLWLTAYILTAIAGWRIYCHARRDRLPRLLAAWCLQLVLNWVWAPLLWVFKLPELASVAMLSACAALLTLAFAMRPVDPVSARLLLPGAVWAGYLSAMSLALGLLNP